MLFDTSVLVAALVASHPRHPRALSWLQRAHARELEAIVAGHTLAELYVTLTTYPHSPRIPPAAAWEVIQENVWRVARIVALTAHQYRAVLRNLVAQDISGGIAYDALIAEVARLAAVDRLLTLNLADFRRVWTGDPRVLAEP